MCTNLVAQCMLNPPAPPARPLRQDELQVYAGAQLEVCTGAFFFDVFPEYAGALPHGRSILPGPLNGCMRGFFFALPSAVACASGGS